MLRSAANNVLERQANRVAIVSLIAEHRMLSRKNAKNRPIATSTAGCPVMLGTGDYLASGRVHLGRVAQCHDTAEALANAWRIHNSNWRAFAEIHPPRRWPVARR